MTQRMPIKFPFNVNDRSDLKMLTEVYEAKDAAFAAAHATITQPSTARAIILVACGRTLAQESWQDVGGVYVEYRVAPLDAHLPVAQRFCDEFEKELTKKFGNDKHRLTYRIVNEEAKHRHVTLYMTTSIYQIGD